MLVRVHSECLTGDVFHSLRCDCGEQLDHALRQIAGEDRGVLLYMAQEGRGIGLLNKLRAYELQEQGLDTVEANLELGFAADAREWGIGNQILADLGLSTIRILTNNPKKISGLEGYGLTVVEQVPIEVPPNAENRRYLAAKRDKLGHRLHHQDLRFDPEELVSDGLDQPRLGLNEEPEEERREDVWEDADAEPVAEPEPEPEAEPEAEAAPEPEPEEEEDVPAEEDELPRLRAPEHAAGELQIPDGYGVIEGEPTGNRRAVGIVVARFNGELTGELLRARARRARAPRASAAKR